MSLFGKLQMIGTDGSQFLLRFPYVQETREKLRSVQGHRYDDARELWTAPATSQAAQALKSLGFAWSADARKLAADTVIREERLYQLSMAKDAPLELPFFGQPLDPYQRAAVNYACERERVIIGDEMGLGKTPEALATAHSLDLFPLLVVAPAGNKWTWAEEEIPKFLPGRRVVMADKKTPLLKMQLADVIVTNYEQFIGFRQVEQPDGKKTRSSWTDPTKKQVILSPMAEAIMRLPIKGIILDEAHKIKDTATAQANALMEVRKHIRYRLLLTGTPVVNRPAELASLLRFLDRLDEFGGWYHFMSYFCGLREGRYGPEAKQSNHGDELNRRLRSSCYIRRLAEDVQDQLPERRRISYAVDIDNRQEYEKAEKDLITWVRDRVLQDNQFLDSIKHLPPDEQRGRIRQRQMQKQIGAERNEQLVRFSALIQITARGKLKAAKDWITNFVESNERGEKLAIFAINKVILDQLIAWYPDAARITSDMATEDRKRNVDRFQADPNCQFIILAAGTGPSNSPGGIGWTLTAARHTLFLQLGFNPPHMDQCEKRIHRRGQKRACCHHYILGHETIDTTLAQLIEGKRAIIKEVCDGEAAKLEVGILDALMEHYSQM